MKCPECGYNIPDGMHKCLCCGYTVTALRVLSEEETMKREQTKSDDSAGYKNINPDDVYFGTGEPEAGGGSIFDTLFGNSPFRGIFGSSDSSFGSFGSIIGDLFGGMFGLGVEDGEYDGEEEDDDEGYTYDALGYRVPKAPVKTMVVTEIEQYDENGELKSGKGKNKKPKKDK